MADNTERKEPRVLINNELEKRIADAFEVFDHSGKQVVDVREIGTILRSLGCVPTEAEIQEVLLATEDKEGNETVALSVFLPYMYDAITKHRFYPADAEHLLAAFKFIDSEGKGYLTLDRLKKLVMEEGEPFTQEEFDEMLTVALDPATGHIPYELYINQLMVDEEPSATQQLTAPK